MSFYYEEKRIKMGRVSLYLVIMFFICSAQKIDAQVQNIKEKQDTISVTKSLEHIRPENIKKGPLNNALDVLSGQSAGVNVTTVDSKVDFPQNGFEKGATESGSQR